MPTSPPILATRCVRWLLVPLLVCLAGCGERDEIRSYDVPHVDEGAALNRVRLLGALLPRGEDVWVVKLAGPTDEVAAQADAFNAVVRSARVEGKGERPLGYEVPKGWREVKRADGFTYAALEKEDGPALTMTITRLPAKGADVLANVNRWRRNDLGLAPVGEEGLADLKKEFNLPEGPATIVDMTGPGARKGKRGGMGPMAGPGVRQPRPLPITYQAPAGWKETGPRGGMVPVLTAFQLGSGGAKAEVTVIPLGNSTGSPLDNYNRWRRQVGLGEVTPDAFARQTIPTLTAAGQEGSFFDLEGPGGAAAKRMLLVVLKHGSQTWYFKMLGPAELVGQQKAAFESFVKSVKFTGAADE